MKTEPEQNANNFLASVLARGILLPEAPTQRNREGEPMKIRASDTAPGLPGVTPHNGKDSQSKLATHPSNAPTRCLGQPIPLPNATLTPNSHQLRISPPSRGHCAAARPLRAAARGRMTAAHSPQYRTISPPPRTPPFHPKSIHNLFLKNHFHHPLPDPALPSRPPQRTPNTPQKPLLFFFTSIFTIKPPPPVPLSPEPAFKGTTP